MLFSTLTISLVLISCNQKVKDNDNMMGKDSNMMKHDSTMMQHDSTMMTNKTRMMDKKTAMYACPMHPEVQGKSDDKCSKCGMKLTKPVK